MASSSDIRKPSAVVQFSGGSFEAQSFVYDAQVGTVPTLSVVLHNADGKGKAVEVKAANFAEMMAAQQGKYYTSRSPDFTADLDDGSGGKLNFKGFSSSVSCNLKVRSVGLNVSAVHAAKVLSSLSLTMYGSDLDYKGDENAMPVGPVLSERLSTTTDHMIRDWLRWLEVAQAGDAKTITDVQQQQLMELHQANEAPLAVWKQVLSASSGTTVYKALSGLTGGASNPVNIKIYADLKQRLRSPAEDFFGVIAGIGEAYQLLYIPPADGDGAGKLVKLGDLREQSKGASVDDSGLDMSCGNSDLTPVTHVMVSHSIRPADATKQPRDQDGNPVAESVPIMVFPDGAFDGASVMQASAPSWLPTDVSMMVKDPSELKQYAVKQSQLDAKTYVLRQNDKLVLTQKVTDAAGAILKEWLKQYYIDMALASSTATVNIPMDLNWTPGTWYDVSSKSGGVIFSGLLAAVKHNMAVASGGGVEASTSLTFTHAEFGSFKLPGV